MELTGLALRALATGPGPADVPADRLAFPADLTAWRHWRTISSIRTAGIFA